ncbi:hypothetical protein [Chryseobacterium sp. YR221]|uniref:hypothetical protein n=1 Tax=Chryseobacterium sp. YR221 TaxID=1500293 RepID=UPI0009D7CF29|nr:hypothetical protein [Chryseobacterium sp. YR221]SMC38175.1 hypothetical protein SAMN02787074_0799 [Chryseobacterium sp. YR221]
MNINEIPGNTPVITTKYVVEKTSDIVYVSFDEEGDFQVFSDEGADMDNVKVVSLSEIIELDKSVTQLVDINKGEKFYRENINSIWQKIQ